MTYIITTYLKDCQGFITYFQKVLEVEVIMMYFVILKKKKKAFEHSKQNFFSSLEAKGY